MKRIEIHDGGDDCPDQIKYDVVPHVALERAADHERNRAGQVREQKYFTAERQGAEQGQSICCQYGDGSEPSDEISEYFEHGDSI